jgi:uncharacterized YigZ family protein
MVQTDTYKTIKDTSEGVFREKGSKFLAFAYPVESEDEIKQLIAGTRKKYHDARHHCYAYRTGKEEPFLFRMNDDGEPSATAGKPIFGQILANELTDILIIVVRYFGGTLLGTSGLIRAYKSAAMNCLENAQVVKKIVFKPLKIHFPYDQMGSVMRIIKEGTVRIDSQTVEYDCRMTLGIRKTQYESVKERLAKIDRLYISDA